MTLEEIRRTRQTREIVANLFSIDRSMWESGWQAIRLHQSEDSLLSDSLALEQRIGLGALARSRETSPYSAVKIIEIDSALTGETAVLHYLVVLKVNGYRTARTGSCMSTYSVDDTKPSGWAIVAHHYKTLSPKRFREISAGLA